MLAELKAKNMTQDRLKRQKPISMKTSAVLALAVSIFATPIPATSAELLMFQEDGGFWSEAWNREVAHIYDKTLEGKAAPLRRLSYDSDVSGKVRLKDPIHFAPTFVLVHDGHELGRIEGYPGQDFFWQKLEKMMENMPSEIEEPVEVSG